MHEWVDGWMDGWMDGRTEDAILCHLLAEGPRLLRENVSPERQVREHADFRGDLASFPLSRHAVGAPSHEAGSRYVGRMFHSALRLPAQSGCLLPALGPSAAGAGAAPTRYRHADSRCIGASSQPLVARAIHLEASMRRGHARVAHSQPRSSIHERDPHMYWRESGSPCTGAMQPRDFVRIATCQFVRPKRFFPQCAGETHSSPISDSASSQQLLARSSSSGP